MNTAKFLNAICLALLVLGALRCGASGQNERGQTAAANNEPSRQPILRIETGMQTNIIRGISVDTANRYLVTASYDQTARIWELGTGRLIRVLRPPIGEGKEGKLAAIAISPDGNTVATGGQTGFQWDKSYCLYLFDRETGKLLRRLAGLPDVVTSVIYSRDGRYLALTLKSGGIRFYETSSFQAIAEDHDYSEPCLSIDVDGSGRFLTACLDGYIRLYSRSGDGYKLQTKKKPSSGNEPVTASFSPDGSKIAVGFLDAAKVSVLAGSDLKSLYSCDTSKVGDGQLSFVAWDSDGQTLFAGGTHYANYRTKV